MVWPCQIGNDREEIKLSKPTVLHYGFMDARGLIMASCTVRWRVPLVWLHCYSTPDEQLFVPALSSSAKAAPRLRWALRQQCLEASSRHPPSPSADVRLWPLNPTDRCKSFGHISSDMAQHLQEGFCIASQYAHIKVQALVFRNYKISGREKGLMPAQLLLTYWNVLLLNGCTVTSAKILKASSGDLVFRIFKACSCTKVQTSQNRGK